MPKNVHRFTRDIYPENYFSEIEQPPAMKKQGMPISWDNKPIGSTSLPVPKNLRIGTRVHQVVQATGQEITFLRS